MMMTAIACRDAGLRFAGLFIAVHFMKWLVCPAVCDCKSASFCYVKLPRNAILKFLMNLIPLLNDIRGIL